MVSRSRTRGPSDLVGQARTSYPPHNADATTVEWLCRGENLGAQDRGCNRATERRRLLWSAVILSGVSTPSLSRVDERGGFSAGHSGLSLLNRGEHALTEIQAFPLYLAPAGGISELVHLDGELA